MNPPKDLGRTKMRKGRKKHLCPSQIFGPLSFPVLGLKARIGFRGILTPALSPRRGRIVGRLVAIRAPRVSARRHLGMNPGRDNCFWRNEWFFKVSMNARPPHEPTQRFGADKDEKRTEKTSLSVPNLWASLLSGSGAQGANRVSGNSHPGPPHEPTQRFGADKDEKRTEKTSVSVPNLWASLLSGSGAQGANRVSGNSHPVPLPFRRGEG